MKLPLDLIEYLSRFLDCNDLLKLICSNKDLSVFLKKYLVNSQTQQVKKIHDLLYEVCSRQYVMELRADPAKISLELLPVFKFEKLLIHIQITYTNKQKHRILECFKDAINYHKNTRKSFSFMTRESSIVSHAILLLYH